jgi:hypothetical protein
MGLVPYGASQAGWRRHPANLALKLTAMAGFAGGRVFAVDPGGMDTARRDMTWPEQTHKSTLVHPKQVAPFLSRWAAGWIKSRQNFIDAGGE